MVDIKGLLSNPMAALQSSRQPGGLLAPVTSFREAVTDPRLFIADALINRTPITTALTNYAAINQSLAPEEETFATTKQAYNPQTGEIVFANEEQIATQGLQPIPDASSDYSRS